jgi:hypothetical protein
MKFGMNVILFEIGTKVGGLLCHRFAPPQLREAIKESHNVRAIGIQVPGDSIASTPCNSLGPALRYALISNNIGREETRLLDTSRSRRYWELLGGAVPSLKVYETVLPPFAQDR